MTDERRQAARRVFMEVADLAGNEREAALDEACGDDADLRREVDALLSAEARAGGFMSNPTTDEAGAEDSVATIAGPPSEQVGQTIGRYKLLQQIGEGGFGVVYMAQQEVPVRRKVALKIIKLGMDTEQVIARFEAERQALAMMDHPNIAKVLDAGATETGRPYFVMELVRGESITHYCDKQNLSVEQRLNLFQQTCKAVQHAHQKGIIHRDIKPSNVMITLHDGNPAPKVIDFGIAKATNQRLTEKTVFTEYRQFLGTPVYMSPEQAEMSGLDIDTRSDIYSLGVLLYELLTGTTPFDSEKLRSAAYDEIQRIIREETPHKPSTRLSTLDTLSSVAARRHTEPKKLGLIIRGDLDWIVMMAMEKDRTRRYETANGFAADIQRYLDSEPVVASPPSVSYKLKKFIKRNKAGMTAASLVAAMIVLGVVGTTWGMVWAIDEKDRADEEATNALVAAQAEQLARRDAEDANEEATKRAEELEQVVSFQSSQLRNINVELMGTRLREDLLARVRATAERSRLEPEAIEQRVAEVERVIAGTDFTGMALHTLEENVFVRALEAIEEQCADQPVIKARLLETVATTLRVLGLPRLAIEPQAEALEINRREFGDEHAYTMTSIREMAWGLHRVGEFDKAEAYGRELLDLSRRVNGEEHEVTTETLSKLGYILHSQGKNHEAESLLRQAADAYRRQYGDDSSLLAVCLDGLAQIEVGLSRLDEAERHVREALDIKQRVLGEDHSETLISMHNLSLILQSRGKYAEATEYVQAVVVARRRMQGDEHPLTLSAVMMLGMTLKSQRRYDEAEPCYREALDGRRRILGDDHPRTLTAINNIGSLFVTQRKFDDAERHYQEALEGRRRILGNDHINTLMSINNMGSLLRRQGRLDEAERYLLEALEGRRRVLGGDHRHTLSSISHMGTLMRMQGRYDEAESYFRGLLDARRRLLGAEHPDSRQALNRIILVYLTRGTHQAWHVENAEYEATCAKAFELARSDGNPMDFERVAKLCSLLPSGAPTRTNAALELARRALQRADEHPYDIKYIQLCLGMAEFRAANDEAAEEALAAVDWTEANLYRAMSIFRQGRIEEGRQLAIETAEAMKPLPEDPSDPLTEDYTVGDLIRWMAYKEAKAMIGF